MTIGGYTINDLDYGIEVKQYESGWSFFLQDDDAQVFRDEWLTAQEYSINFRDFLNDHEYSSLFC
tara:strand:+ start:566 stop:760 length:195 start_codon:yes stop_codon:yes gene_type:complete